MKGKILIVDDDEALRDILGMMLRDAGFEVDAAQDEAEFHQLALGKKPDLMILDIMLGDTDGTTAYHKLLLKGFDKTIPVIFLTALAKDYAHTEPQPGRVYALLGKPFDYDQLVREVCGLLRVSKAA